jgi:hypothetical protein
LEFDSPSELWTRRGKPVKITASTTGDDWVTQYDEVVFDGITQRQATVPTRVIKIKAVCANNKFLDKTLDRQLFINEKVTDIMESLLEQAGVASSDIDITTDPLTVPVYGITNDRPIRWYIEDLCKSLFILAGFDKKGKFKTFSLAQLAIDNMNPSFTADNTYSLDHIKDFKNIQVSSDLFFNSIKITGKDVELIPYSKLYYNTQIREAAIEPLDKLFFEVELGDLQPFDVSSLRSIRPPTAAIVPTQSSSSEFAFYTADEGGVPDYFSVDCIGVAFDDREGENKVTLIFENGSGNTLYLRLLILRGSGIRYKGDITEETRQNASIDLEGREIRKEIASNAITTESQINKLSSLAIVNFSNFANVYQFEARVRPNVQVGSVVDFYDKDNNLQTAQVVQLDEADEAQSSLGYVQTLKVRKFPTLPPGTQYFTLDVSNLDGSDPLAPG